MLQVNYENHSKESVTLIAPDGIVKALSNVLCLHGFVQKEQSREPEQEKAKRDYKSIMENPVLAYQNLIFCASLIVMDEMYKVNDVFRLAHNREKELGRAVTYTPIQNHLKGRFGYAPSNFTTIIRFMERLGIVKKVGTSTYQYVKHPAPIGPDQLKALQEREASRPVTTNEEDDN